MPALSTSMPWMRMERSTVAAPWLTPAQRAVRVLQVTRANWPVLPDGRRRKRREASAAARFVSEEALAA